MGRLLTALAAVATAAAIVIVLSAVVTGYGKVFDRHVPHHTHRSTP